MEAECFSTSCWLLILLISEVFLFQFSHCGEVGSWNQKLEAEAGSSQFLDKTGKPKVGTDLLEYLGINLFFITWKISDNWSGN